ncbi:hypothetical protein COT97_04595 [Candidatus Falkowbacteria bacterium CG10_big_fil_rev_8_21_14_0_10_39_11]|uniref:Pili assembly chaperone n=1 Tax=Candidatus Falkowbacteria bacterium CG10_big_fil_rev_8_21_14_0_10_39_11 TaxID=1974565 RepID=A0A2H0V414_9BACT|nr:MAG: hypothetical protein COT97_04595 [Candidatus Falkowbacteria bacterium CG10_big_fil_rev_8_21_14_0_10_39_11]
MFKQKGFTLLEVLLVVAIIAILAGIVILALNPAKQLADTNNSQRWVDVNTILNGVYQYSIDNNGEIPASIPNAGDCEGAITYEICNTGSGCTGLVDLSVLTNSELYLTAIPQDPTGATASGAGYHVIKSNNNRITVCAPDAELSETIEVTR